MEGQPTWTDCDEAGDYVVPNVLSPRDLVFRPDNMDETVPHIGDYRITPILHLKHFFMFVNYKEIFNCHLSYTMSTSRRNKMCI